MAVEGMVEDLIKSDADINMTDEWGKSALLSLQWSFKCSSEVRHQLIYEWVRLAVIAVVIYSVMYVMLINE